MDLQKYYGRIRSMEREIAEEYPVIVSLKTPDGGQADVFTEAPRALAARLIVEGKARLASEREAQEFRQKQALERQQREEEELGGKLRLRVISDKDLELIQSSQTRK